MKKIDYKKSGNILSAIPYILIAVALAFITLLAVHV